MNSNQRVAGCVIAAILSGIAWVADTVTYGIAYYIVLGAAIFCLGFVIYLQLDDDWMKSCL